MTQPILFEFYFLVLVQYQLMLAEFWLVLVIHFLIFHDGSYCYEITQWFWFWSWKQLRKNLLKMDAICIFHRSFLPFFAKFEFV